MSWLDPLRARLDSLPLPAVFFFRNDDAGWDDGPLLALLDLFEREGVPVDLAVIPAALGPRTARELRARFDGAGGLLGLHQHGFAHVNHEPFGRSSEFGVHRPAAMQRADLRRGRERLQQLLGARLDPIFTPPWNRCTPLTGRLLRSEGFRALSRDLGAGRLGLPGLGEVPISVDWSRRRRGRRMSPEEVGDALARAARPGGAVGVMLHHALLDAGDLDRLSELLRLVREHGAARATTLATRLAGDLGRAAARGEPA